MPDIAAISGLTSSLKATTDIAKAMLGIRDAQLVREKAIELTTELMSAQQGALATQAAQFELVERVRDLEAQIRKLEDWDSEKKRYELQTVATGVFAYATKAGMEASEPPHQICANCYQNRRKSVLQTETRSPGRVVTLVCNACGAELITSGVRHTEGRSPTANMRRPT